MTENASKQSQDTESGKQRLDGSQLAHTGLPGFINTSILVLDEFQLLLGGCLETVTVNINCYGSLKKPVIVVLGGISSSCNIHDWWKSVVKGNSELGLEDYCVIGIDYAFNDSLEQPKLVSSFDQAAIVNIALQQLQVEKLHAFIGCSYGGMVALAYAARYPKKLSKLICIAAAHKNSQFSIGLRQIQQQILQLGYRSGKVQESISIARQLGVLSYRGRDEIESRFDSVRYIEGQSLSFDILQYLQYQGQKFADRFELAKYFSLSQSIDLHKVNPKDITAESLFIGIDSDQLVPSSLVEECSGLCAGESTYQTISSQFGHDGFLLESGQLTQVISPFLRS